MADTGREVGWIGAEAKGEPVLAPAELHCPPSLDATDLVYRSRCWNVADAQSAT